MSADRKQKWLVFATKFQKMKPEDQKRSLEKMDAWVKLTPEQRLEILFDLVKSQQPDDPEQRLERVCRIIKLS